LSGDCGKVDVSEGDELDQAAHETIVANGLGIFTGGVAWCEVGDNAHGAVVEATEKSVLPLVRHFEERIKVSAKIPLKCT